MSTNKYTNNLDGFTIYENGQLVKPTITARIVNASQSHTARVWQSFGRKWAIDTINTLDLMIYDTSHNTHLLREQLQQKRQAAYMRKRVEVGL